jgi:hypothetical protein
MFIRLVSARNPGNIGRVSEAAVFGLHVARGSGGSVSARASKYSWLDEGRDFSGGLQHHQNRCGAAKEVEPAIVGGDWLNLKAVPSSSTKSAADVYKQTVRRSSGRRVALTGGLTKLLYIPAAVAR